MTVLEAKRTSLADYEVLMKAASLREIDSLNKIHMQAWTNQAAKATRKRGKSYVGFYKDYQSFFNYSQALKEAWEDEERKEEKQGDGLINLILKANMERGVNNE